MCHWIENRYPMVWFLMRYVLLDVHILWTWYLKVAYEMKYIMFIFNMWNG